MVFAVKFMIIDWRHFVPWQHPHSRHYEWGASECIRMRRNHSILLLSLILLEFISFCSIYAFINSQSIAFYYHNFLIIASFVICINPEKRPSAMSSLSSRKCHWRYIFGVCVFGWVKQTVVKKKRLSNGFASLNLEPFSKMLVKSMKLWGRRVDE